MAVVYRLLNTCLQAADHASYSSLMARICVALQEAVKMEHDSGLQAAEHLFTGC
jgi:hypothetical protein